MSQRFAAVLVVFGVLLAGVAHAGPTRQALDAAADAVYLDFARDGVVASPDEVNGKYQEACDLGYDLACRPERWHDADGLPSIELAGPIFDKSCTSQDPVACVVAGWAIEARPLASDLERDERRERERDRLKDAAEKFFAGCRSSHWSACLELGRYSWERYSLNADPEKELVPYKNGARNMYRTYCGWGHQRACVALGELEPQVPELLDTRNSAGYLYRRACDEGFTKGCYRQGLLVAPLRSMAESRHWFDGLCDRGHTGSCEWVARSYADDSAAGESSPETLSAWKRACFLHSTTGCSFAGPLLEESSPAEARQVHRMGCALDDGVSCGRLGLMLVEADEQKNAVTFLDRGCAAGVIEACVQVGLLRKEGVAAEATIDRAREDLQRGCPEDGTRFPVACHELGRIYQEGVGSEQDRVKAAGYFRLACNDGHLESCIKVGESVMALQPAARNARPRLSEWALQGFVKACDAGTAKACLPAAELYAVGPPGVRDEEEARRRYEELLGTDNALAARSYGSWLRRVGTEKDLDRARDAFRRGMELGDTESARLYADMLFAGIGGPRQRGRANRVYRKACADGNPRSCGGFDTQGIARP